MIIIGLMVSGVLAGQSLIQSAKIQAVINDYNNFRTSINAFILEYNGFPGDFDEGFEYFGSADCIDATVNYVNQGCNGNGDKRIHLDTEGLLTWRHLSLAELIKGEYTGMIAGGALGSYECCTKEGENIPESSFEGVGWWLRSTTQLILGARLYTNSNNWHHSKAAFEPAMARKIDLKLDNGLPNSGKVTSNNNNNVLCIINSNTEYNLSYKKKACNIYFDLQI